MVGDITIAKHHGALHPLQFSIRLVLQRTSTSSTSHACPPSSPRLITLTPYPIFPPLPLPSLSPPPTPLTLPPLPLLSHSHPLPLLSLPPLPLLSHSHPLPLLSHSHPSHPFPPFHTHPAKAEEALCLLGELISSHLLQFQHHLVQVGGGTEAKTIGTAL